MTKNISFKIVGTSRALEVPTARIAYLEPHGLNKRKAPNPPHTMIAIIDGCDRQGRIILKTFKVEARVSSVLKAIKQASNLAFVRVKNHDVVFVYSGDSRIFHTAYVNPQAVAKLNDPDSAQKIRGYDGGYEHPRWAIHFKLSETPLLLSTFQLDCSQFTDYNRVFVNKQDREVIETAIRSDASLRSNAAAIENRA
jgi:hypothetical protein